MSAILDQADVLYFLLGGAALGFLALGWMKGRPRYWLVSAGCIALIGLLFLLSNLFVTDRQQIIRNLDAMKNATIAQKPDELFKYISRDFRFGTQTREETY